MSNLLRTLWAYRGFVFGSVKREFQAKYLNSLLGAGWAVLNPLAMIIVYTVIFSQVMQSRLPGVSNSFGYSIFLCAGVLTWGLFSEVVARATSVFLEHANLIKKLNFPRICLPAIVLSTALLNFAIIFGLFTAFLLLTGNFPGWVFFTLIPVFATIVLLATGLGVTFGVLNVFFRDVGQFVGVFLQFWFWFTPIVYPLAILPDWARKWVLLNPMTWLIGACQGVLVVGDSPDWLGLAPVLIAALVLCGIALMIFRKRVGEMVDEL
ncbi:ABC transporter permease [Niveibacterium umoris]|uniref:Transport permease protein n=1 Tax=Niveibacterium umoris TaxID=1193620 RepID=A0A840BMN8_9RHOO|nr:ABC transporter permease [Niveibacterium umoris]MBB4012818.1 lipopolysaccharide transport system permease protein [Niveibacterium umoris]